MTVASLHHHGVPCHLALASLSLVRAPAPIKPKRLQATKIIASCYQKAYLASTAEPQAAWWFCEEAQLPLQALPQTSLPQLNQGLELTFALHNPLGFFFNLLANLDGCVAFLSYGSCKPSPSALVASLSQCLTELDPTALDTFQARWQKRPPSQGTLARIAATSESTFVLQDRPGKMVIWDLAAEAAKQERLVKASREATASASHETEGGWGACAAMIEGSPLAGPGYKTVWASPLFTPSSEDLPLEMPALLSAKVGHWLTRLGEEGQGPSPGSAPLRSLYLIAPSLALGAALSKHLLEQAPLQQVASLCCPDFTLGWSPLLTFMDFLKEGQGPRLLVDAGQFPAVSAYYRKGGSS